MKTSFFQKCHFAHTNKILVYYFSKFFLVECSVPETLGSIATMVLDIYILVQDIYKFSTSGPFQVPFPRAGKDLEV